jgi:large subunit ribosomal protein L10
VNRLPLTRHEKQQLIDLYKERLQGSEAVVVLRNNGLTVADMTDLRKKLGDQGAMFQVTKNTLFKIALADSQFPVPEGLFTGTVGVCYVTGVISSTVRVLNDYLRDQKKMEMLGAMLPGEQLDASAAKALVELPTREQALAQLLGTLQGPLSSLVNVIDAPLREIITVLHARSEQTQEAIAA